MHGACVAIILKIPKRCTLLVQIEKILIRCFNKGKSWKKYSLWREITDHDRQFKSSPPGHNKPLGFEGTLRVP